MSTKQADTKIHQFIKAYVESKKGGITEQSNETFTVTYPTKSSPKEYTYQPCFGAREKNTAYCAGSPAFQQILKECLENGVLCQILLNPKESFEALLKGILRIRPLLVKTATR